MNSIYTFYVSHNLLMHHSAQLCKQQGLDGIVAPSFPGLVPMALTKGRDLGFESCPLHQSLKGVLVGSDM